ncbi:hypothetical protein SBBP1_420040 [Burkholderiales bacterium]|nr:hypothetical protein SBBP1_420040 [Burkholderiales bacterium]
MPDSPLSPPAQRAWNRSSSWQGTKDKKKVNAYTESADGACLAAPPRDVGRMLERYGAALPRYLDVHRLRDIEASHQRWPLLRPVRPQDEGGG